MELLQVAKVVPMPYLDVVCRIGVVAPCIVLVTRRAVDGGMRQISTCEFFSIEERVEEGRDDLHRCYDLGRYVCNDRTHLREVTKLLSEFQDVMPHELPKMLRPKGCGPQYRVRIRYQTLCTCTISNAFSKTYGALEAVGGVNAMWVDSRIQ